jgi:hypothetical protein
VCCTFVHRVSGKNRKAASVPQAHERIEKGPTRGSAYAYAVL